MEVSRGVLPIHNGFDGGNNQKAICQAVSESGWGNNAMVIAKVHSSEEIGAFCKRGNERNQLYRVVNFHLHPNVIPFFVPPSPHLDFLLPDFLTFFASLSDFLCLIPLISV
jgi:hypothetical protein